MPTYPMVSALTWPEWIETLKVHDVTVEVADEIVLEDTQDRQPAQRLRYLRRLTGEHEYVWPFPPEMEAMEMVSHDVVRSFLPALGLDPKAFGYVLD